MHPSRSYSRCSRIRLDTQPVRDAVTHCYARVTKRGKPTVTRNSRYPLLALRSNGVANMRVLVLLAVTAALSACTKNNGDEPKKHNKTTARAAFEAEGIPGMGLAIYN